MFVLACEAITTGASTNRPTLISVAMLPNTTIPYSNFDSNSRGNNKWMTSRLGGSKGFDECTEILQHHHGEEVIVLDTLVCLFAKFTPQIPILDELERSLCTPLRVINNIAVTPVDDLGA